MSVAMVKLATEGVICIINRTHSLASFIVVGMQLLLPQFRVSCSAVTENIPADAKRSGTINYLEDGNTKCWK